MKRVVVFLAVMALAVGLLALPASAGSGNSSMKVNVLLNTEITDGLLAELSTYGNVKDTLIEIDAVFMQIKAKDFDKIAALPFVDSIAPDAERKGAPIDTVEVEDFFAGVSTWDLDAINVTDFLYVEDELDTTGRSLDEAGLGVYVAVLDTGLLDSWRQYFPQERIATEYAKSFGGGGGEKGNISEQPNKWEHDTNSHGTHVTSTILGYSLRGTPINGVAPLATVIPVKVLNQNGSGWSSTVAAGITYVAELKAGSLAGSPVVINMSLGGPVQEPVEKAAVDYAISKGVVIVASAGNEGEAGMGYPGAYEPVISVAASGWVGEWTSGNWWTSNVPDPTNSADFYITDFSSRELSGQDLDVAAPGSWVVGPYQLQQGKTSYYFLGGTSMASPHVAGIVALMLEKDPELTANQAETALESSAIPLAPGCRDVLQPSGLENFCWGADATGWGLATADAALAATPAP